MTCNVHDQSDLLPYYRFVLLCAIVVLIVGGYLGVCESYFGGEM